MTRLESLRLQAQAADDANQRLDDAVSRAFRLVGPPPAFLDRAHSLGLDSDELVAAWSSWVQTPPSRDAQRLATQLQSLVEVLTQESARLRRAAATELAKRDDAWRPLARELAAWMLKAQRVAAVSDLTKSLQRAEKWVRAAAGDIRDERFRPIADQSRAIWERLRQQSNVELGRVALAGATTNRRVELDVTVDGAPGAALGIMSQGELNCLALSLFLPRATLPESPFRFVVIDDPVQAMDPARVDGLARVLADTAATRQVIVFTHDDRLPESIRRLGIAAALVEVTRRTNSVVELRPISTPAKRAIDDAMALAQTTHLPSEIAARVVAGFCRLAIEAACSEVIRRRRIGRGEPHASVESLLQSSLRLAPRLALALFDDAERAGDVPRALESRFGKSRADAYYRVNRGAHQADAGDLVGLVRNCEGLLEGLVTVA